jgi:hypothetical protein
MAKGVDPYRKTCEYKEEGTQFGESFECSRKELHKGSHYDAFTEQWAPSKD